MGKQSRQNGPADLDIRSPSLETRGGTRPLARAFGGMLQGLGMAAFLAAFCVAVTILRLAGAALFGNLPPLDGVLGIGTVYVGGFLLGGAVGGALAPVRHRIGGRRAQAIAMAAVTLVVWWPRMRGEEDLHVPGHVVIVLWVLGSVVFGLMFAKLFTLLDPDPPPTDELDTEPR
jgi:hypothetical protein